MKRFTIPCTFGDVKAPFHIYVGEPAPDFHPLYFQSAWLSQNRGGVIPPEVMESFQKLHTIAKDNNVSFEELCVYALGTAKPSEKSEVANPKADTDIATDQPQVVPESLPDPPTEGGS